MSETKARKPKRVLRDIDFSKSESHIALVSKEQGGPANGANYALVIKADKFSPEFVAKASKVRITMDITDFLSRFYGVYYNDAEVLARALGFDTEKEKIDYQEEDWYEKYIDSKVEAIEVMKSIKAAESIEKGLSALNEDDYYKLILTQEKLENIIKGLASDSEANKGSTEIKLVENKQVEPSGSEVRKSENENMTVKTEMVEKSQLDTLQKSFDDMKVALEKALGDVEVYKAKEREAISKARFAKVLEAVKDEDKAKALFKGLSLVESDEEFDAAVDALAAVTASVEKSDLFKEKGAQGDSGNKVEESAVAKAIKANQAKNK
jgi:hypothetical protein